MHSGHGAKISVELQLMSAICRGRKQSVSHPEEMSFEKYELEDNFTHSEKRQVLLTVD